MERSTLFIMPAPFAKGELASLMHKTLIRVVQAVNSIY